MQDSEYVRTSYTRSCMVIWLLGFVEPRSLNLFTFHVFMLEGMKICGGDCHWVAVNDFLALLLFLLVDDLTLANIFSRLC